MSRFNNYINFRDPKGLTNETIAANAPAVLSYGNSQTLSTKYKQIPTIDVIEALRGKGFIPIMAGQTFPRKNSKHTEDHTFHVVRFHHEQNKDLSREIIPEIVVTNSHNGTSAYKIMHGVFRSVCANGLITGDIHKEFSVKHIGKAVIDDVIDAAFHVVEQSTKIYSSISEMKSIPLQPKHTTAFATAAMALRWDEGEEPISPDQLLIPHRQEDYGVTNLWTTFNVVQENLIKGGMETKKSNYDRRQTVRKITSVKADIKLNKALWTLAEMLKEKVG